MKVILLLVAASFLLALSGGNQSPIERKVDVGEENGNKITNEMISILMFTDNQSTLLYFHYIIYFPIAWPTSCPEDRVASDEWRVTVSYTWRCSHWHQRIAVMAWIVVIRPRWMPNLSLIAFASGAGPFVVREARDSLSTDELCVSWFPCESSFVGTENTILLAPVRECVCTFSAVSDTPVDSHFHSIL